MTIGDSSDLGLIKEKGVTTRGSGIQILLDGAWTELHERVCPSWPETFQRLTAVGPPIRRGDCQGNSQGKEGSSLWCHMPS